MNEPQATPPEVPTDVSFARTLLQFFVIPMGVVIVGVSLFLGFAWLVSDDTTAEDYLNRIRTGGSREQRQAAFELANRIQHGDADEFRALAPDLVQAFAEAPRTDPWVRQYLALALGTIGDPLAAPALIGALEDDDPTVQVYAAWALGAIGDPGAGEALARASRFPDAGVRTMAVYALGAIGGPGAAPALARAMEDPESEVAMNAVVALARLGDRSAEDRLLGMLEPEYWTRFPDMNDGERKLGRLSAIQAAGALRSPAVLGMLREIGASDPDLRTREVALRVLAGGEGEESPPALPR